jgi:hypothetical protein
MIRLPIVIAIMFFLPHVAHAEDVAVRSDMDEQHGPNNLHQDQDNDDRDRAAGVPNCNEVAVLPCFEKVWVGGVQFKMAFFDLDVKTNPPTQNFYVVAPQTGTPQGIAPFLHDHVIGDDDGSYWHGFLALCSDQAISSGACVTSAAQGDLPLAKTVHGQRLTTAERIESAVHSGLIVLVDTGAVLLARIDHCAGHHGRIPDRR